MKYLLLGLGLIVALVELVRDILPPGWSKRVSIGLGVLALLIAGFSAWEISRESKAEQYAKESGTIRSLESTSDTDPVLVLCESGIVFKNLPPGMAMFGDGRDEIRGHVKDGRIMFSTIIRDAGGEVRASITDNVWFIPKNPNAILDRNFDESGLEILDAAGDPILQVELDRNMVRFARKSKSRSQTPFGPLLTECGPNAKGGRMFEYPSSKFPGVRRVEIFRAEL